MTTQTFPTDLTAPIVPSNGALWTGRVLTAILSALLLLDSVVKLARVPQAVEGTVQLGYPAATLVPIGFVALFCLVLYVIPRTAVLGAILWTGYFGGAVATHLRAGNPLFTHILSPVYFGAAIWLALWLRDRRVRALIPFRG